MAYDPSQEDDEESQIGTADSQVGQGQLQPGAQAGTQSASAQPVNAPNNPSSGGGGGLFGSTPAVGGSATAGANPAPKSNSSDMGWTNLTSYLNANQSQASAEGQAIAGQVNNDATNATNAIGTAATNWNNEISGDTTNYNSGEVNQALTDAGNGNLSSSDLSNWTSMANAENTTVPQDFTTAQNYGAAANATSNALNALQETQSEAGRDQLLQQQYSGASQNGYDFGENSLDQALIEGNQNAQQALSNVNQQWSGLAGALGIATAQADADARAATATNTNTSQQALEALGNYGTYNPDGTVNTAGTGALGNWASGVEQGYNTALTNYNNATNAANATYNANNSPLTLTAAELQAMGLTPGESTYGALGSPQYATAFTPTAGLTPTAANTATAQNYAQAGDWQELINAISGGTLPASTTGGTATPYTSGTAPISTANAAQAGTAAGVNGIPDVTYNTAAIQNAISQAQTNNDTQLLNYFNTVMAPGTLNYNLRNTYAPGGTPLQNAIAWANTVGTQGVDPLPQASGAGFTSDNGITQQEVEQLLSELNQTAPSGTTQGATVSGTSGGQTPPPGGFAYGGAVKMPTMTKVAAPMKEPRIPKMPKADYALPSLPTLRYAQGGAVTNPPSDPWAEIVQALRNKPAGAPPAQAPPVKAPAVAAPAPAIAPKYAAPSIPPTVKAPVPPRVAPKYPIRTPEQAQASLAALDNEPNAQVRAIVRKQIAAHHPALAKAASNHWDGLTQALKRKFADGGQVPETLEDATNTENRTNPSGAEAIAQGVSAGMMPAMAYRNVELARQMGGAPNYAEGGDVTLGQAIGYPGSTGPAVVAPRTAVPVSAVSAQGGTPYVNPTVAAAIVKSAESGPSGWDNLVNALSGKGDTKNFKSGGKVPGRAKVPGDSYKNDDVPALLSSGEVVIDRDTLAAPGKVGQEARDVAKAINTRNRKGKKAA